VEPYGSSESNLKNCYLNNAPTMTALFNYIDFIYLAQRVSVFPLLTPSSAASALLPLPRLLMSSSTPFVEEDINNHRSGNKADAPEDGVSNGNTETRWARYIKSI
jgi:hypothetical protein